MSNVMNNDNCQEYDFSLESFLPRYDKPFHFFKSNTHNVSSNQLLKQEAR